MVVVGKAFICTMTLHLSPVRILKKQPANTDLDGKIAVVCVIFGFYLQFSERFKKFLDLSLRC